jgi:50S ribosomal protein L16 3-hydroxylase
MEETLLGVLSPQAFLRRHWQKRPLLVRGALPGFRGVIGRSALFSLAGRDDAESRLVERLPGSGHGRSADRWRVTHGPLPRASLDRLARAGARDWTLLVNGVDGHRPAAERLLRRFAFVPEARLDDVMVSYAATGGGVGPHVDSYDVFLVQGEGRRRWRLARRRRFALVPDAPLRLIDRFVPDEELVLGPGDLLYLPPGWGHDGVALEDCFTCSVGFRAPGGAELAAAFLDYLHERGLPDASYADPGLRATTHPGRIERRMIDFAERQLARIRWTRRDVGDFVGRTLSTPRPSVVFRRGAGRPRSLERHDVVLDPRTRMLYRGARFFLNGESFLAPAAERHALGVLADRRRAPGRLFARAGLAGRVRAWHRDGFLKLEVPR